MQLPYDPGPTIKLQVSPMGAMQQQAPGPMTSAEPAPVAANTVVVPAAYPYYAAPYPAYPYGYYRPYYPAVSVGVGVHGHWR